MTVRAVPQALQDQRLERWFRHGSYFFYESLQSLHGTRVLRRLSGPRALLAGLPAVSLGEERALGERTACPRTLAG